MSWFFTDDCDLQDAVRAAGEEIVSVPSEYASGYVGRKYPLSRFLMAKRPTVLVVVFTVPVHKQGVLSYSNMMGRRAAVIGVGDDAAGDSPVEKIKSGRWPKCTSSIHNLHGYVTNDESAAIKVCGDRRVALWSEGDPIGHVKDMIGAIMSGRVYQPGRAGIYRKSP